MNSIAFELQLTLFMHRTFTIVCIAIDISHEPLDLAHYVDVSFIQSQTICHTNCTILTARTLSIPFHLFVFIFRCLSIHVLNNLDVNDSAQKMKAKKKYEKKSSDIKLFSNEKNGGVNCTSTLNWAKTTHSAPIVSVHCFKSCMQITWALVRSSMVKGGEAASGRRAKMKIVDDEDDNGDAVVASTRVFYSLIIQLNWMKST